MPAATDSPKRLPAGLPKRSSTSSSTSPSANCSSSQAKRTAARQTALDEAVALRTLHKMQHQPFDAATAQPPNGFVFSASGIEAEAHRQRLLAAAKHVGFDLKRYRQAPLRLAA